MQDSSTASFVARNSPANLPPDHRPEVAYTPSYNHLDSIFQAIRQQLQQWGDQAKWKIELVLLTPQGESLPLQEQRELIRGYLNLQQYSLDESAPLLQSTINDTRSAWRHRPTACQGPHQINSHETATTRTNNELEQKLKDALKKQKHLENLVKMQDEQLRKLQIQPRNVNETIDAMRNMHIAMEQEQREKHSMETKLLRKEIHALSRKLKRMQMTLQRIENIRNSPEVERLDREELLEDRVILIRKLRLAELRLAARDAELTYLHDVLWLHEQQSDSRPKRKQQQQQQETDINQDECSNGSDESPASNELSKLESLGILADQMLSDPEFRLDTLSPPSKRVKRARYEDNAAAAADKDCPPLRRKIRSKVQQIDSSQPANNFAAQRYTRPPPRASESPSIAALLDTPIQSTEPSKQKSAFHNYIPEQHQTSNPSFSAPPSTGASTFYPKIHAEHFPATLMSPLPSSFKARPWSVDMQQQQSQRHGNTYSM